MYEIEFSKKYLKYLELMIKRGNDIATIKLILTLLVNKNKLPDYFKEHKLKGNYKDCLECHITSDWLLIYKYYEDENILYLIDTGTHSDIFG